MLQDHYSEYHINADLLKTYVSDKKKYAKLVIRTDKTPWRNNWPHWACCIAELNGKQH